jgi:hypothetical protein
LRNRTPGLRGLIIAAALNLSVCRHLRFGWSGRRGRDALPRNAPGHSDPDPQYPPDVFRLHSVYDGSSDPAYAALRYRAGALLFARRSRSK